MLVENRRFEPTSALFRAPLGVISLEFRGDFWHQETIESLGYRTALLV